VSNESTKDDEGFVLQSDVPLASVRAYKEDRHGNEKWANRAAFSTATSLFRFRRIPKLVVTTEMFIICNDEKYNIVSVEDVKGRGMYTEVLADKTEPSVR
jgi:SPP1 family predicted phage head-tail adaptor